MKLPKELTTVTPISKALAMLMFIVPPICAFFIGSNYQQMIDQNNQQQHVASSSTIHQNITPTPTPSSENTSSWKTYTNKKYRFSIKYPNNSNCNHAWGDCLLDSLGNQPTGGITIQTPNADAQVILIIDTSQGIDTSNTDALTPAPDVAVGSLPYPFALSKLSQELTKPKSTLCQLYDYSHPTQPIKQPDTNILSCQVVSIGGKNALRTDWQNTGIYSPGPYLLYIFQLDNGSLLTVREQYYSFEAQSSVTNLSRTALEEQVFSISEKIVQSLTFY